MGSPALGLENLSRGLLGRIRPDLQVGNGYKRVGEHQIGNRAGWREAMVESTWGQHIVGMTIRGPARRFFCTP